MYSYITRNILCFQRPVYFYISYFKRNRETMLFLYPRNDHIIILSIFDLHCIIGILGLKPLYGLSYVFCCLHVVVFSICFSSFLVWLVELVFYIIRLVDVVNILYSPLHVHLCILVAFLPSANFPISIEYCTLWLFTILI